MLWGDVVTLVSVVSTRDDIGDTQPTEAFRMIFANKKSVRQTEYYQALSVGLKPEIMFVVRTIDYNDEAILLVEENFEEKRYKITRVFTKNDDTTELICEKVI